MVLVSVVLVCITVVLVLVSTSFIGSSVLVVSGGDLSKLTPVSVLTTIGSSFTVINETNGALPVRESSCTCTKATNGDNMSNDRSTLVPLINVELMVLVKGNRPLCCSRGFFLSKTGFWASAGSDETGM